MRDLWNGVTKLCTHTGRLQAQLSQPGLHHRRYLRDPPPAVLLDGAEDRQGHVHLQPSLRRNFWNRAVCQMKKTGERLPRADETVREGVDRELDPVLHSDLPHQRGYVCLDRTLCDPQS